MAHTSFPDHFSSRGPLLALIALLMVSASLFLMVVSGEDMGRDSLYEVELVSGETDDHGGAIALDHTVEPGCSTIYSVEVRNTGALPDTYALSASDVPVGWNAMVTPDSMEVYANSSGSVGLQLTAPMTGIAEHFTSTIKLNAISLADPANSSSTLNAVVRCEPVVDIELSAYTEQVGHGSTLIENGATLSVRPGQQLDIDVTLLSNSNVDDTMDLTVGGPTVWDVEFPDYSRSYKCDLPAFSGQDGSRKVPLHIMVPDTVENGDIFSFSLGASSEYAGSMMDDPVTRSMGFSLKADFTNYVLVSSDVSDVDVDPGGSFSSSITVTNLGYVPLIYHTPFPAQLEGDSGIDVDVEPIGNSSLEPLECVTYSISFSVPASAKADTVSEFFITGSTDRPVTFIPARIDVGVNHIHDLSVVLIPENGSVLPGHECTRALLVTNDGNGNESVELSLSSYPEGWGVEIEPASFFLVPGQRMGVNITSTSPSGTLDGDYDVGLMAYRVVYDDVGNKHYYPDIATSVSISVMNVADLVLNATCVSLSDEYPQVGEMVMINVTVPNRGGADALNVLVSVSVQTLSGSIKNIGSQRVDSIPAGGSVNLSFAYKAEIATKWVLVSVDENDEICELIETNNDYKTFIFTSPDSFDSGTGATPGTGMIGPSTYAIVIASTAIITTIAIFAVIKLAAAGKFASFSIPGAGLLTPLYSKIRQDDLLNNTTRETVYDYIREHPGVHFRSIMSGLDLSNGTLSHHLQTLERGEFIKSERDGVLRRYYPRGRTFTGDVVELNKVQRKIMTAVAHEPGMSQKELAMKIGISAPTVNYHLNGLKAARLVKITRHGKRTQLFLIRRGS